MRVPTATTRTRIGAKLPRRGPPPRSRARGSRGGDRRRNRLVVPQALEPVKLAHPGQHNVDHDVLQIDEYPLAVASALGAEWTEAELLGLLNYALGDRADVSVG